MFLPIADPAQARLDALAQGFEREGDRLRKQYERGAISAQDKLVETCRLVSYAFGGRFFGPEDVLGWFARVPVLEAAAGDGIPVDPPVVGGRVLRHLFTRRLVPNARLRERFEALRADGQITSHELASRIGLTMQLNGQTVGDASAVERMLGVAPGTPETGASGRVYRSLRMFVAYDQAVALADALGLDYHDVGV